MFEPPGPVSLVFAEAQPEGSGSAVADLAAGPPARGREKSVTEMKKQDTTNHQAKKISQCFHPSKPQNANL